MSPMERHFTATVFVFDQADRVLLLWHKRLQKWMPPGGHIDPNELPEEAAKRECLEETGLEVEIEGEPQTDVFAHSPTEGRMLLKPFTMLLENIPASEERGEPAHQHIDFIFRARVSHTPEAVHNEREAEDIRWFTGDEVLELSSEKIFENVRLLSSKESPSAEISFNDQ